MSVTQELRAAAAGIETARQRRVLAIAAARHARMTWNEIASDLGITDTAARRLHQRAEREKAGPG